MTKTIQTTTHQTKSHRTMDLTAVLLRLPVLRAIVRQDDSTDGARLAAELSDYRTDADRNDLNALFDQYPDSETTQLRELLNRQPVLV